MQQELEPLQQNGTIPYVGIEFIRKAIEAEEKEDWWAVEDASSLTATYVEGVWSGRLIKNREVMVGSKGIFVECGWIQQFKAQEFDTLNSRSVVCKSMVWDPQWLFWCLFDLVNEVLLQQHKVGEGLYCFESADVNIHHTTEQVRGRVSTFTDLPCNCRWS